MLFQPPYPPSSNYRAQNTCCQCHTVRKCAPCSAQAYALSTHLALAPWLPQILPGLAGQGGGAQALQLAQTLYMSTGLQSAAPCPRDPGTQRANAGSQLPVAPAQQHRVMLGEAKQRVNHGSKGAERSKLGPGSKAQTGASAVPERHQLGPC